MSIHDKFILSPISDILEDAVVSCSFLKNDIRACSLSEYIMQTTFLKLTGAGEQKCKCILWELASADYEFRYSFLKNQDYGECSDYKSKCKILNDLIDCTRKNNSFEIEDNDRLNILTITKDTCNQLFNTSVFKDWFPKDLSFFENFSSNITTNQIIKGKTIFANKDNLNSSEKNNCLKDCFECMYSHRNRCAHNLLSYQDNTPPLSKLLSSNSKYENWFSRYFILCLLDNIFIFLFKKYSESIN